MIYRTNVFMSMFALPEHLLPTGSGIVMSCALIPGTELCSNVRVLGGQ